MYIIFVSHIYYYLKFGDGDGPNLNQDFFFVSSTFIENIFRSGLTLVSSNDIITIKIDKKMFVKNQKKINKQKRLFKIKFFILSFYKYISLPIPLMSTQGRIRLNT